MKTYQNLSSIIDARLTCIQRSNETWITGHEDMIYEIMKTSPSGSGIDDGTLIDLDKSTGEKLIFSFSYHHMNENGYYDGWTEHRLIVTPSLQFGLRLRITGPDRNQIKDYLYDVYREWLNEELKKC